MKSFLEVIAQTSLTVNRKKLLKIGYITHKIKLSQHQVHQEFLVSNDFRIGIRTGKVTVVSCFCPPLALLAYKQFKRQYNAHKYTLSSQARY